MPTSLRVAQDSGGYDIATLIKRMFQIQLGHTFWKSTNIQVGPFDAFTTRPCNRHLQAEEKHSDVDEPTTTNHLQKESPQINSKLV